MSEAIKQKYRGVEIIYMEDANKWHVLAPEQGMDAERDSLVTARTYIDNKLDKKAKAASVHILCLIKKGWTEREYNKAVITSLASNTRYSHDEVWISYDEKNRLGNIKKTRQKISINNVYKDNEENNKLNSKIKQLSEKITSLENERCELESQMENIKTADIRTAFSDSEEIEG